MGALEPLQLLIRTKQAIPTNEFVPYCRLADMSEAQMERTQQKLERFEAQ